MENFKRYKSSFTCSIILLLLLSIEVNAQAKINQFDLNGKRNGIWKKIYTNNNIRYEGEFKAGKEIGVFNYYNAEGSAHPIIVKIFNKYNEFASVKFYSNSGVLESSGEMQGENRIGKWVYFHPDGKTLLIEEFYKNGVLNGEFKSYYKTGKITEILNYKDGKLHGNVKRFADNGNLLDDLNYKDGKLQGLAKYYNIDGQLIYSGNYENDEKVGKWQYMETEKKKK